MSCHSTTRDSDGGQILLNHKYFSAIDAYIHIFQSCFNENEIIELTCNEINIIT